MKHLTIEQKTELLQLARHGSHLGLVGWLNKNALCRGAVLDGIVFLATEIARDVVVPEGCFAFFKLDEGWPECAVFSVRFVVAVVNRDEEGSVALVNVLGEAPVTFAGLVLVALATAFDGDVIAQQIRFTEPVVIP